MLTYAAFHMHSLSPSVHKAYFIPTEDLCAGRLVQVDWAGVVLV